MNTHLKPPFAAIWASEKPKAIGIFKINPKSKTITEQGTFHGILNPASDLTTFMQDWAMGGTAGVLRTEMMGDLEQAPHEPMTC